MFGSLHCALLVGVVVVNADVRARHYRSACMVVDLLVVQPLCKGLDFQPWRLESSREVVVKSCKWLQMRTMPACVSMINKAKTLMRSMRPTDCSKIARAMGKLDLQDEELCITLVDALKVFLPDSPPIAVAGIMAGLGQVSYR
jgi:hypothetical protein